jgi:translation initiation factor 3 subunit F
MMRLHRKVNRKEVVVGWYASVSDEMPLVADTSSAIHEFYTTHAEDGDPIHLVVDTRLVDDSIQIRGYTSSAVLIQNEPMATLFHEVKVIVQSSEAEAICLHEMQKQDDDDQSTPSKDETSVSLLHVSMEQLLQLLETTSTYVDDVVAGTRVPDPKVGRDIADVLAEVPRIKSSIFEKVFHENLQDLLMVTYLSSITRTQLDIAEKLHASLGI